MTKPPYAKIHTRPAIQRRIFLLVGMLASIQFVLNALSLIFDRRTMIGLWVAAAIGSAVASVLFEMYKTKQAKW